MRTSAYDRVSRDDADPARQRAEIERWAQARGIRPDYYQDIGGRRHEAETKNRPQWQALMARMRAGDYDALVVEEVSRLGFADEWALMSLCHELRKLKCQLWEARTDRLINGSSVSDFLTTGVSGMASAKEVRDLAARSLGQKVARIRDHGTWTGGLVPHGMIVECRAGSGSWCWRMEAEDDGTRRVEYPDGSAVHRPGGHNPGRSQWEHVYLVPTLRHPERIEQVRLAFGWWLRERISFGAIARRLNELGSRPVGGGIWYPGRIRWLLSALCYTGHSIIGRRRRGRYHAIKDGGVGQGDGTVQVVPPEEWVWSKEPVFTPPVIERDEWMAAQELIRRDTGGPRKGKNPGFLLSGLVYCSKCGRRMTGLTDKNRKGELFYKYGCNTYSQYNGNPPSGCRPHFIRQDRLLALVDTWLEEAGIALDEASGQGEEGLLRQLFRSAGQASQGLREAREAMERWLEEALQEVCEPEIRDGRKHYDLGPLSVALPGASFSEVWECYQWLGTCSTRAARGELERIEQEHDRLTDALINSPTPQMRDKIAGRARELEAEMSRLRAGSTGLSGRVRGLMADLGDAHRRIIQARKDLEGRSATRRAAALREVIERITVHHELSGMRAGKPIAKVAWVRIEPKVAASEVKLAAAAVGDGRSPGRACRGSPRRRRGRRRSGRSGGAGPGV